MAILALNIGSSSLKFGLFDECPGDAPPCLVLQGQLAGTNGSHPHFRARHIDGKEIDEDWAGGDPDARTGRLLDWLENGPGGRTLAAVGHRVVHGGRMFRDPVRVDGGVIQKLETLIPLAPLHQPASLAPMRHIARLRPDLPQVACFDTAFHHDLAPPVSRYPLPRALEEEGVRRYGFHGLSYEAIADRLAAMDDGAADERVIVAHLGNGASLCAMRHLHSVDTTMGFTALDGLMMGTRPGTLDPGILLYLQQAKGYDVGRLEHMLYHECGLLGVSGSSADVAALLASDRPEAREALDLFAFRVARETAAMAATLGGIDRFVFTGGIGEHGGPVRAMIGARLGWLGAEIDAQANAAGAGTISTARGRLRVQVLATDEEGIIARHTARLLRRS